MRIKNALCAIGLLILSMASQAANQSAPIPTWGGGWGADISASQGIPSWNNGTLAWLTTGSGLPTGLSWTANALVFSTGYYLPHNDTDVAHLPLTAGSGSALTANLYGTGANLTNTAPVLNSTGNYAVNGSSVGASSQQTFATQIDSANMTQSAANSNGYCNPVGLNLTSILNTGGYNNSSYYGPAGLVVISKNLGVGSEITSNLNGILVEPVNSVSNLTSAIGVQVSPYFPTGTVSNLKCFSAININGTAPTTTNYGFYADSGYSNYFGGPVVCASTLGVTGALTGSSTVQGTTLNGTTGINTGATGGTQRIDASGNISAAKITASGAIIHANETINQGSSGTYSFTNTDFGNDIIYLNITNMSVTYNTSSLTGTWLGREVTIIDTGIYGYTIGGTGGTGNQMWFTVAGNATAQSAGIGSIYKFVYGNYEGTNYWMCQNH